MAKGQQPKGGFKTQRATPRVDGEQGTVDDSQVTHLRVRSHAAGFRRAGRAWSTSPTTVRVEEFTAGQVEQLLAEPMLVVEAIAEKSEAK